MSVLLWVLGSLLVAVGLAGIVFPALPGTVLIFAGLLLAAWADGFTRVGGWTLLLIGIMGPSATRLTSPRRHSAPDTSAQARAPSSAPLSARCSEYPLDCPE
jgi:hypothetical protein